MTNLPARSSVSGLSVVMILSIAGCAGANMSIGPMSPSSLQSQFVALRASRLHLHMPFSTRGSPVRARLRVGNCPKTNLIYITSGQLNAVLVYGQKSGKMQNQCGEITAGIQNPQGLATDNRGDLFVTNAGSPTSPATIVEFTSESDRPALTIPDTGAYPSGVAAAANGDIIVTNATSVGSGPGNVMVFSAAGQLVATMNDPKATFELYPTTDSNGDIFTTYLDANYVGHVNEFVGSTPTEFPMTYEFPGNPLFDNGSLLVLDNEAKTIDVSAPPYQKVSRTIGLNEAAAPFTFSMLASGRALYTADGELTEAQEYSYPKGKLTNTIHPPSGLITQVAVYPNLPASSNALRYHLRSPDTGESNDLAMPGTCKPPVVLISDQINYTVDFYEQKGNNQQPCFQIDLSDGRAAAPSGLFVDKSNNLYVGRGFGEGLGAVLKYVPPYTGVPEVVCTTPNGAPYGLAVDDAGTVYAGDYGGFTNFSDEFTKCKGSRSNQVVDTALDDGIVNGEVFFLLTDAKGNLFDNGWDSNQVVLVDESTDRGRTWKTLQTLGTGYPGGLALDGSGDLYINNDGRFGTPGMMLQVAPPYTGTPKSLFTYKTNDVPIALTGAMARIWSIADDKSGVEYSLAGKVTSKTQRLPNPVGITTIPSSAQ